MNMSRLLNKTTYLLHFQVSKCRRSYLRHWIIEYLKMCRPPIQATVLAFVLNTTAEPINDTEYVDVTTVVATPVVESP